MKHRVWKKILPLLLSLCLVAGNATVMESEAAPESENGEKAISVEPEPEVRPVGDGDTVEVPEPEADTGEDYVDLSDHVLQAGGFLPEEDEYGISTFALSESSYEELKDLLYEGLTNHEASIDIDRSLGASEDDVSAAFTDVFNENYQFFYVYPGYSYTSVGDVVIKVTPIYSMDESEAASASKKLESAIDEAVDGADASFSDLENALYLNDYLDRHCAYEETGTGYEYTAYGALVEGEAVCQGYAIAYNALADRLGLSCDFVTSESMCHVWNVVKVNGSYYHEDATWNDPVADRMGRAYHEYLLKSSTYFRSKSGGHDASDWVFSGGVTESEVKSTTYDSCFWDDSNAGFEYIGSTWYALIGSSLNSYTCNGSKFTKKKTITTVSDKWYVWGTKSYYYAGYYSTLAQGGNLLFYSRPDCIYAYDPSDGSCYPVYTLSSSYASKGYIYGILVTGSNLTIYLATAPSSGVGTYKVLNVNQVEKDLSYADISLSKTSYTYNGSAKKPSVAVKFGTKTLTKNQDYTVSYSNNTDAGTAKVTVTGKGNYTGNQKVSYKISKAAQSLTAKAKSAKITKGKTTTISAKGKGTITYSSGNKKIATVNSKGKVTAKSPGKVNITVKAKGNDNYKSASKKVAITVKPKAASLKSVKSASSRQMTVKWKKSSGITGYQIQYSTSKTFKSGNKKKTVKGASKTSQKISSLKRGKTYYVRIRTYKTVSGTKFYSSWSEAKKVKVKR